MQITWHGQYTVKIVAKDAVVVLDPYNPSSGLSPFRAKADIVGLTNPSNPVMSHLAGVTGDPKMIQTPGEYSFGTTSVYCMGWFDEEGHEHSVMRWNIEGISILHLGALPRVLTGEELTLINQADIDVMLVPVGGGTGLTTKDALAQVSTIEPRVVIPIHYKVKGDKEKLDSVEQFAKEMGVSPTATEAKFTVRANSMPQDDMQTIILKA